MGLSYSYDGDIITLVAEGDFALDQIEATFLEIHSTYKRHFSVFSEREEALAWLLETASRDGLDANAPDRKEAPFGGE